MGQILPFKPRKGVVNMPKRTAMKKLILAGTAMDAIAQQLGYASGRSALVMATRWGLHVLRPESFSHSSKFCQR